MNILIIEDEKRNFNRLKRLLEDMDYTLRIDGPTTSIAETVDRLRRHPAPDLILADIRLTDGLSFDALEQSEAYRQAVQTQLVATIANSYYNLLTLDRQLDISLRTLDSWTEIVRTYEVRKRVGEANEAAVAQALANKLSVEGSVLTLRKQIRAQENSLSALLGRVPGPVSRTTLGEQRFPEKLAVGVPCNCSNAVPTCARPKPPSHRRSITRMPPARLSIRASR